MKKLTSIILLVAMMITCIIAVIPVQAATTLKTDKTTYYVGDPIYVTASSANSKGKDWVGIGISSYSTAIRWQYTKNMTSKYNIAAAPNKANTAKHTKLAGYANFPALTYVVKLVKDDGGFGSSKVIATKTIKIVARPANNTNTSTSTSTAVTKGPMTVNKTTFKQGEAVVVSVNKAKVEAKDWIGIGVTTSGTSIRWQYAKSIGSNYNILTKGKSTATHKNFTFKPGTYVLRYVKNDKGFSSYSYQITIKITAATPTVTASKYQLVVPDKTAAGITDIVNAYKTYCYKTLPVVELKNYKGGAAIFFGCGNADGTHRDVANYSDNRYFIEEKDGSVFIDFKTAEIGKLAAKRFIQEYLPTTKKAGDVSLNKYNLVITELVVDVADSVTLKSHTEETLADGVYYTTLNFTRDADGKPVRAFAIVIKKGAARLETGMPKNGIGTKLPVGVQLLIESRKAENADKTILAGTNGDFFAINTTQIMSSLCIQNGVVIHEPHSSASRYWIGTTFDGETVIGNKNDYANTYKGKLAHAIGGSQILLKNEVAYDYNHTEAPRTATGITPDGDIVILVVDGRQPGYSEGATLTTLAQMMGMFGCSTALNNDGGGSSTMVLNNNGKFQTQNKPSDGTDRYVANSIMVVVDKK